MSLTLVVPSIDFKDAFLRAVDDYRRNDHEIFEEKKLCLAIEDFDAYLSFLNDQATGISLHVPQTTHWLVNEYGDIAGISRLRHYLNDFLNITGGHIGYDVPPAMRGKGYATELLHQTLAKAREKCIDRVLLTVHQDKLASIRVIEKCGGKFSMTNRDPETDKPQNLYWIELS